MERGREAPADETMADPSIPLFVGSGAGEAVPVGEGECGRAGEVLACAEVVH